MESILARDHAFEVLEEEEWLLPPVRRVGPQVARDMSRVGLLELGVRGIRNGCRSRELGRVEVI